MNLNQALEELEKLIIKAEKKHPGNRWLYEALMEELGEMASEKAPYAPGNKEALDAACILIRIYMLGTTQMPSDVTRRETNDLLDIFVRLGKDAKEKLDAAGVPE